MRSKLFILFLLIPAVALLFFSCRDEPVTITEPESITDSGSRGYIPMHGADPDTCNTESCIEDFLDDETLADDLYIHYRATAYDLGGPYIVTEENDYIRKSIRGMSPLVRPTLELGGPYSWDEDETHATLHFAGPEDGSKVILEDLIIYHDCYMQNGNLPGVQFETDDIEITNVTFTNSSHATTHFMSVGLITIDDCVLSDDHQFAFGPEDWCGGDCGGFGNPMPADGSEIKNSDLYGEVMFDVYRSGGSVKKFYFRDNDPVTDVYLDSNSGSNLKIVFEDNEFADVVGAIVDVNGDFRVEASGNVTYKGPCYEDAMDDFDITGSDHSDPVDLQSWEYDGTLYCMPEISNLNSGRVGNTVSVTWSTECTATSKVIWGTSCDALSNTATGSDATSHIVGFTVPGNEGCIYFRAISAFPCDTCTYAADTSACDVNVMDIVISNINTTFSPFFCTYQVTWTTNVKSNSAVYFGSSCAALNNISDNASLVTNHSIVCDVSGISGTFAYKVKSENSCDSAESSCNSEKKESCFGQ
jgi:hypothetical protein